MNGKFQGNRGTEIMEISGQPMPKFKVLLWIERRSIHCSSQQIDLDKSGKILDTFVEGFQQRNFIWDISKINLIRSQSSTILNDGFPGGGGY
jgi:hypothetical protein